MMPMLTQPANLTQAYLDSINFLASPESSRKYAALNKITVVFQQTHPVTRDVTG
jgi:hypothetical protein